MTRDEAHALKPGDHVHITGKPHFWATVLDRFTDHLILAWEDGQIRHHTAASFEMLDQFKEGTHDTD